jgi:hypothetical protein
MTISTKYDIGDMVWFMYDNICVLKKVENINIDVYHKYVQYFFDENSIWLSEKHLFSTKEELLKSL